MSGDEPGKAFITCLHPAPLTGIPPKAPNIQNTPLFFFEVFFFSFSISSLLSPNQDEKSPEQCQRQQFTLHREQGEKKIRAYFQTR